jgi:hypothetical protein
MTHSLIDLESEYRPLLDVQETEADEKERFLPSRLTVPAATWEVAQRARALLAEVDFFSRVDVDDSQGAESVKELLTEAYMRLWEGHDEDGDNQMRQIFLSMVIEELVSNGVRRRNPDTGLWTGLSSESEELTAEEKGILGKEGLCQRATVTYGIEEQPETGVAFFVVHVIDEAKGWPPDRRGFNPYAVPNVMRADQEQKQLAVCRRGMIMMRRFIGQRLKGTGFYLPLEPNMNQQTMRTNEPFIRLPLPRGMNRRDARKGLNDIVADIERRRTEARSARQLVDDELSEPVSGLKEEYRAA